MATNSQELLSFLVQRHDGHRHCFASLLQHTFQDLLVVLAERSILRPKPNHILHISSPLDPALHPLSRDLVGNDP